MDRPVGNFGEFCECSSSVELTHSVSALGNLAKRRFGDATPALARTQLVGEPSANRQRHSHFGRTVADTQSLIGTSRVDDDNSHTVVALR